MEEKNSGCGLENRNYGRRYPPLGLRNTLNPIKLALTSPISGGRSRTEATKFCDSLLLTLGDSFPTAPQKTFHACCAETMYRREHLLTSFIT
jgi:hypothetical protein